MRKLVYAAVTCLMAAFLLGGSQFIMPIFEPPVSTVTTFSLPTGSVLHFLSPTGNDANDGLTPATAWLTPNHAMKCGEVILGGSGSYPGTAFPTFGTVSNCPSTTGGIDGTGDINFAILLCAGSDLASCDTNYTTPAGPNGFQPAFDVAKSNWAVMGWTLHGFPNGAGNNNQGGMQADGSGAGVHHVAFVNNVVYNVGIGFGAGDNGTDHSTTGFTNGFDYVAFIGNIAQNAQQNDVCTAAIVGAGANTFNTTAGTHILFYGNFSFNHPNNGCISDIEGFMFDTWDAHGYLQQSVMLNNTGWSAYRFGIQKFNQNINSLTGGHDFILNNTLFANATIGGAGGFGNLNIQQDNSAAPTITILKNIADSNNNNCGLLMGGASGPGSLVNIVPGTTGSENILFSTPAGNEECLFNGAPTGTNTISNPTFNNTSDLLTNRSGVPDCTTFQTVTACMGWDANTSALTNPSVIYDLTPTCAQCGGKGYQLPSTACVTSGDVFTYYPSWLKGVGGGLHASAFTVGAVITERRDLVTIPCGL